MAVVTPGARIGKTAGGGKVGNVPSKARRPAPIKKAPMVQQISGKGLINR